MFWREPLIQVLVVCGGHILAEVVGEHGPTLPTDRNVTPPVCVRPAKDRWRTQESALGFTYLSMSPTTKNIEPRIATMSARS